jgi:hypothetical protein
MVTDELMTQYRPDRYIHDAVVYARTMYIFDVVFGSIYLSMHESSLTYCTTVFSLPKRSLLFHFALLFRIALCVLDAG